MSARIAVLASGSGTNLQALIDFLRSRGVGTADGADVVLVASDNPDAGALQRARDADIHTAVLRSRRHTDGRDARDVLREQRVDFIALAGYLQLVPREIIAEYPSRVVNVHPALLPAFGGPGMYGDRVHRAVLLSGARVTGATVHYVDDEYDHGTILAQWPVPVLADDSVHSLAARVLKVEHVLYPRVIAAVATKRWRFDARPKAVPDEAAYALMHWDEKRLIQEIEDAFGL